VYNFFPARDIATAFIKRAEAKAGIPILLDVDGTFMAPPWDLPGDTSTVLLLDRAGRIVWKHSGKLFPDQTERMLDRLTEMARGSTTQP
jgi:predicted transcriptional regulator